LGQIVFIIWQLAHRLNHLNGGFIIFRENPHPDWCFLLPLLLFAQPLLVFAQPMLVFAPTVKDPLMKSFEFAHLYYHFTKY